MPTVWVSVQVVVEAEEVRRCCALPCRPLLLPLPMLMRWCCECTASCKGYIIPANCLRSACLISPGLQVDDDVVLEGDVVTCRIQVGAHLQVPLCAAALCCHLRTGLCMAPCAPLTTRLSSSQRPLLCPPAAPCLPGARSC
jgi:hypothetical protein